MSIPLLEKIGQPTPSQAHAGARWKPASRWLGALLLSLFTVAAGPSLAWAGPGDATMPAGPLDPGAPDPGNPSEVTGTAVHVTADRAGQLATFDGLTLRLNADMGSVRIVPLESGVAPTVRYTVHIETDAREPQAKSLLDHYVLKTKSTSSGVEINGTLPPQAAHGPGAGAQFWVHFEVMVPAGYHVEVKTGAGDIEAPEIGGSAMLTTQGGNILAGSIGVRDARQGNGGRLEAKLETEGGHIQVREVAGNLSAFTAGGHIIAGSVSGDASLRSGGGHIRAGKIGGRADLETDGGNITVSHAENFVNVRTGGGQIDFGEVRGSVHAQTAGGGIRVMYVSGPMEVVSNGGSICLTRVAGAVQAATMDGTITAWINPEGPEGRDGPDAGDKSTHTAGPGRAVRLAGPSQLASGNGDIVVFLPRNLAANIEAMVASGDARRIIADPAIHLAMQPGEGAAAGSVRAFGELNGGGAPLKLRTTAGSIRLQFLDSETALRDAMIRDQLARLNQKLNNISPVAFDENFDFSRIGNLDGSALRQAPAPEMPGMPEQKVDWLDNWVNALEVALTGTLREDPTEFQKRLSYAPHPAYPSLAQTAGVQGLVKLQVRVTRDGRVEVTKLLEGEPVLADAAIATVKQWRAKPGAVNGKPVEVSSTVTFNFQLH
jgi:TonB family protein